MRILSLLFAVLFIATFVVGPPRVDTIARITGLQRFDTAVVTEGARCRVVNITNGVANLRCDRGHPGQRSTADVVVWNYSYMGNTMPEFRCNLYAWREPDCRGVG